MKSKYNVGQRLSTPSTSRTPVGWHGISLATYLKDLEGLERRPRNTRRSCPILANSIASKLVRTKVFQIKNCMSAQLVAKEVPDFWKVLKAYFVNI